MASKELVRLAKYAARAHSKAAIANNLWAEAFEREYGHNDISDALVEHIDYSSGNTSLITADFIDKHSEPGKS